MLVCNCVECGAIFDDEDDVKARVGRHCPYCRSGRIVEDVDCLPYHEEEPAIFYHPPSLFDCMEMDAQGEEIYDDYI